MGTRRYLVSIFFAVFLANGGHGSIKVCKSYADFYELGSKNCWKYDYDHLNPGEIAQTWGFQSEEYSLTLKDGYIITVFRVFKDVTKKNPIILGHSAASNSLAHVTSGNNSIAYVLGNLGYDVWMINWRGTLYSMNHTFISNKRDYYNNFTFHQMGIYDIKATADLVYKKTNQKAIYIGHSQGTTASYIYCSLEPESCKDRLIGVVSLAPVAVLYDVKGLENLMWPSFLWSVSKAFFEIFFDGAKPYRDLLPLLAILAKFPLGNYLFVFVLSTIMGFNLDTIDPTYFPIVVARLADNTGAQTWGHYSQIYNSRKFRQFDFGKKKNLVIYNSETPPEYPLGDIPVPVALFTGHNDYLASKQTSQFIYSSLKESSRCGYYQYNKTYVHYDFIFGKDNQELLYKPLAEKLREIEEGRCKPN